jgi:dihydropteroate synthase
MAGIGKKKLLVDTGIGYGKNLEHNLKLLRQLSRIAELGVPVLAGLSRKGMIGKLTGRAVYQRESGSGAAALIAAQNGASFVRVHDVGATADALAIWRAVAAQEAPAANPAKPAMPKWPDDD